MMRFIGIFVVAAVGFVVFALVMSGVVEPALEALKAWVVTETGSAGAGSAAILAAGGAAFGLIVAATS